MKIITDPYQTTMGKATPLRDIPKIYEKFLILNMSTNLNFEIASSAECKIVFITGTSRDEQELPFLEQPIVIDVNHKHVIVYDVRKYVRKSEDRPSRLKDIFSNESAYELIVTHALLLRDYNSKNFGIIKPIEKNLCSAVSMFLGNIASYLITLDPIEKLKVELTIAHYFYFLNVQDEDVRDVKATTMNKIFNTKLSLQIPNIKFVEETLAEVDSEIKDINTLVSNINLILPEEKRGYISVPTIVNRCRNMWYGPGGDIIFLMGLECIPNMVALVNSALNDKSYKRSMLSTTLDKFSTKIKPKEIEQFFKKYLEDNIM